MGTSLVGLLPQNTYVGLIKVGNNTALNATLKTLSDGAGNDLPMQASTTAINFTGTTTGLTSGVAGAIQFSNGSAFASDAANFFWDNTNKRLGVGTNTPTATTHIRGVDQLSTSTSLLVTDSIGTQILRVHNQANNSAVVMTTAKIANYEIISGDVLFNTSMRFVPTTTGLAINKDYSSPAASTLVHIKGSGSTSATTSLLVQNSAGTEVLKVTDDGNAKLGFAGTNDVKLVFQYPRAGGGIIFSDSADGSSPYGRISLDRGNGEMRVGAVAVGGYFLTLYSNGSEAARFDPVQSLGIGTTTINSSAKVQISSTTKGFLPPVMTTTQKNAIASPATGLQVFDSTMNATCEYNGTGWRVVSAGAQSVSVTGALQGISFANGNVANIDMQSSTTFSFTNATIGTYILKITQGGAGGYVAFWPANVYWSGGTAPVLTGPIGKTDIITLVYDGTNYYGNYSLNY